MGDIAVYAPGAARCAGGAGAMALLIGPNAAIAFPREPRAIFMQHSWDFYKPNGDSEYPVLDGPDSLKAYFHAIDQCYATYKRKMAIAMGKGGRGYHYRIQCVIACLYQW
jgi:hydroxymethylglutaryl-CoA synthase